LEQWHECSIVGIYQAADFIEKKLDEALTVMLRDF